MELRTIIAQIMWRIAPALWLGWAIRNLLAWAINILNDREERFWLEHDRSYAHWFGGWLAVIAARIDELIDLRAHMRLGRRWAPRVVPSHSPTPGVRSLEDCILRLSRLIERFEDVHRLAQCRAETLQRLKETADPLGLAPIGPSGHFPHEWGKSSSSACGGGPAVKRMRLTGWRQIASAALTRVPALSWTLGIPAPP